MARNVGVDVGTGTICVSELGEGKIAHYSAKDAFFKIDPVTIMQGSNSMFGERMLKKSGANYIKVDGILHVLGDDAVKFANLFHKEALRPMAKGVLNPKEPISAEMVQELIRGLAGNPVQEDDCVFFCVPAKPIDADFDIEYHTQALQQVFVAMGYKNAHVMNEALAIVYAELEDKSFTGVTCSFGAGMCNVCHAFMGVPVFSFSIARSGDWIDENAAKACNETSSIMQYVKESGLDIRTPSNNKEKAIAIYYTALMDYVIAKFKELYANADSKTLPNILQPLDVVFAGGTTMAKGFSELFAEKVKGGFPFPVGEVRQAKDPLFTVSEGLLKASQAHTEEI